MLNKSSLGAMASKYRVGKMLKAITIMKDPCPKETIGIGMTGNVLQGLSGIQTSGFSQPTNGIRIKLAY